MLWQPLAPWVPDPGHDPHAVVVAHRLRQVEHGLPLAVVGVDLAGGRTQPLHIRGEQVQLGLGMDGRDRTRLVAGIDAVLEFPGLGKGPGRPKADDGLQPRVRWRGRRGWLGGRLGGVAWPVGVVVDAARSTRVGGAVVVGSLRR